MIRFTSFTISALLILGSCSPAEKLYSKRIRKLKKQAFKEVFLKENGDTIHYLHQESGLPKLLLIHGFSGDGVMQWYPNIKYLNDHFDLILPDLWFHGKSYNQKEDYSIQGQVELIHHILEDLNVDSIAIVGNSYGGLVATEYTLAHPEKISQLVIYDGAVKFYSIDQAHDIALKNGKNSINELLIPKNKEDFKNLLNIIYYKPPRIPGFIRKIAVEYLTANLEEKSQLLDHLSSKSDYYADRDYSSLNQVSILWGRQDQLIPMSTCKQLINYFNLDSSDYAIFEKGAHVYNLENPKDFSLELKTLLK